MNRFASCLMTRWKTGRALWLLIAGPVIWLFHFLASYITAAIACARSGNAIGTTSVAQLAIAAYTIFATLVLLFIISRALRHAGPLSVLPWQDASTGRHRRQFMGFTSVLLAGLSLIAVLYTALAAVFIRHCA